MSYLSLMVLAFGTLIAVVDGATFGAPLQMTQDANGVPEYYCKVGEYYLNIGESTRTSDCYDCNCSYSYGLECVSIGSALHSTGHIQGCQLVALPNCCYKYVSLTNSNEDCVPETCPN